MGLGLLLLAGCAKAAPIESSRPDAIPRPRNVIVLPFDASSLIEDDRWMGEGVAQLISLGLVQHPTIVQVDRSRVTSLNDPEIWSETVVRPVARELHADAALYGRLGRRDQALVLRPLLLDTRTGRTASLTPMSFSAGDFLTGIGSLPAVYARELQPGLSEAVKARIEKAARPTDSLKAFELFTRGQMALYGGNKEAAVDLLARAIEVDQTFVIAYYRLGLVHVALGNRWKAAAQFRACVQLDSTMPEPPKAIGDLFLAAPSRLFDQTIEAYSRAIKLRPFYADAHVGLGDAREAKGDLDGAIAAYQTALRFDPFNPRTHARLGKIWADRGRCADSVNEYKRAIELDPRTTVPAAPRCEK